MTTRRMRWEDITGSHSILDGRVEGDHALAIIMYRGRKVEVVVGMESPDEAEREVILWRSWGATDYPYTLSSRSILSTTYEYRQ